LLFGILPAVLWLQQLLLMVRGKPAEWREVDEAPDTSHI
jgi:hypothetical protein